MLGLTRKVNQRIKVTVGEATLWITVVRIEGHVVRLGFDAPPEFVILRDDAKKQLPGQPLVAEAAVEVHSVDERWTTE